MKSTSLTTCLPAAFLVLICCLAGPAAAFDRWSQNGGDATNCGECHGDFRSASYTSLSDGMLWGNLHNIHRMDMLGGDCNTCHSATTFPVILNSSTGGEGLQPIACVGCHGRAEDNVPANPDFGSKTGYGAGLRQHHTRSGVTRCVACHQDAEPGLYTPVGEDVLPGYYANPGANHPQMPDDPCNANGSEDFAGAAHGLDNDGDTLYDGEDSQCASVSTPASAAKAQFDVRSIPNPFGAATVIRYSLPRAETVRLSIYTVTGELVRTLVDGRQSEADRHEVEWDGRDEAGSAVAPGVYFYRLQVGSAVETRRLVVHR